MNTRYIGMLLILYVLINIYVSLIQEKILIIGDRGDVMFEDVNIYQKFSWSASLGFLNLDGTLNKNRFKKIYVFVPIEIISSSPVNIHTIKKLSSHSKVFLAVFKKEDFRLIENFVKKYNLNNTYILY